MDRKARRSEKTYGHSGDTIVCVLNEYGDASWSVNGRVIMSAPDILGSGPMLPTISMRMPGTRISLQIFREDGTEEPNAGLRATEPDVDFGFAFNKVQRRSSR